jgi:type II secretory pathway component PulK
MGKQVAKNADVTKKRQKDIFFFSNQGDRSSLLKIALNVAQSLFCQNECITLTVYVTVKRSPSMWVTFVIFKKKNVQELILRSQVTTPAR